MRYKVGDIASGLSNRKAKYIVTEVDEKKEQYTYKWHNDTSLTAATLSKGDFEKWTRPLTKLEKALL